MWVSDAGGLLVGDVFFVAGSLDVFESDDACHGLDGDGRVCGCFEAPAGVCVCIEAGVCKITMGEEDEVDAGRALS